MPGGVPDCSSVPVAKGQNIRAVLRTSKSQPELEMMALLGPMMKAYVTPYTDNNVSSNQQMVM